MSEEEEVVSDIPGLPKEGTRDPAEDLGKHLGNPSSGAQRKTLPCDHSSSWKAICAIGG